ncbi:segregation and condensation protein A [Alkalilimnicola sp. S0819]|uniref:segregation and condensation protein A n=1 Tax=Alkalilimnicola sp. S0819 TaxID=2613922 RepID=UPI001261A951|nr:ScpA family protein [Alkalilimnicola sp. S0819]KAB7619631.1 segregation/condensation protein A [Alkalilimnicola sp. S0819]MPQ17568.1 segregation/condensation protein A [Alkalilimnicola sp. S0819]
MNQVEPLDPAAEAGPVQQALALVRGEPLTELPVDLYIPPDALEVFLETFEGPLDLLLYLIRRQNLDVLDIPIARITLQYMEYVELMKDIRLELAAEYLVMAAMLAEIKSRMLLPRPAHAEDAEEDPRAELVRRLQEYERYKTAAEDLDTLPRTAREIHPASAPAPDRKVVKLQPEVSLKELLAALAEVLQRAEMFTHHQVRREALSVRERMSEVLSRLSAEHYSEFPQLFSAEEGRLGVVVTFLAVLELIKNSLVELVQQEAFAPIYVRARA